MTTFVLIKSKVAAKFTEQHTSLIVLPTINLIFTNVQQEAETYF